MIKKLSFFSISLLMFHDAMAAQVIPSYLCRLSITSPNGESSFCNAVHIGKGRLLSASHCFSEGKRNITEGVIVAKCGNEEFSDFTDLILSDHSEDIALLKFSPNLKDAASINPTKYPALYFSGSNLNPSANCEILALRGDYARGTLKRVKITESLEMKATSAYLLVVKSKTGSVLPQGTNVIEGDSGGALICKTKGMGGSELIGIIKSYSSKNGTRMIIQNSFTPVFSPKIKTFI